MIFKNLEEQKILIKIKINTDIFCIILHTYNLNQFFFIYSEKI
jgi:hypothetical protein